MDLETGLIVAYQTAFGNKLPAVYVGKVSGNQHQLWTPRGKQKNVSEVHSFDLENYEDMYAVTGDFKPIYKKTHPTKELIQNEQSRYIVSGKDLLAIIQQEVEDNCNFEFIDNPDLRINKIKYQP
jgi:hypothetical protein